MTAQPAGDGILVFARMRPPFPGEVTEGDGMREIRLVGNGKGVHIKDRFVDEREVTFHKVFSSEDGQEDVFWHTGEPVVQAALNGKNGTFLVYGQTGTGKTYTAFNQQPGKEGIMHRSIHLLFSEIQKSSQDFEYKVTMQYFQLYNDAIQDLLAVQEGRSQGITIKESTEKGVHVSGLETRIVGSPSEVLQLFEEGSERRVIRLTNMNAKSSRSHALFVLMVQKTCRRTHSVMSGKLSIVDLAGSERIKRTKAQGMQRHEAQAINLSLTCLGNVIHALADRDRHVPYRNSRLTRLLQDSLGEYGRAVILVTLSPTLIDITETMSSVQFGQRALKIKQQMKSQRVAVNHHQMCKDLQAQVLEQKVLEQEYLQKISRLTDENLQLKHTIEDDEALIDDIEEHIKTCTKKINHLRGKLKEKGDSEGEGRMSMEEKTALELVHAAEVQKIRSEAEKAERRWKEEKEALVNENRRLGAELSASSTEMDTTTGELITARSDIEILHQELAYLRSSPSPSPTSSPYSHVFESVRNSIPPSPAPAAPSPCAPPCGMGIAPKRWPLKEVTNH
eukprot:TRINITY_DN21379_c0_g1_i1.p1 TRINITY_DN21379_c0_g1~~TRINITY_DN21379_c0_g1_i1.p1  ORF type:complete len:585 (+),score=135.40 TRINITY_DN21379_c0_g1_i1:69-1757(+)